MNFKPTKWKIIVSVLMIFLVKLAIFYSPDKDSNLLITLAPSIFVYLIWSLFEKRRS